MKHIWLRHLIDRPCIKAICKNIFWVHCISSYLKFYDNTSLISGRHLVPRAKGKPAHRLS